MKKYLILVITLISLFIPSAGFAQSNSGETPKASSSEQTETEEEEEETRKEVLPPIIKPSLLPGPKFEDENSRTGREATNYVTQKLLPMISARLLTIIAVGSLLGMIYAGVMFYLAMGDPEKMAGGKRAAIYSVVGLIIALLSFSIVQIINLLPFN
jgi:hypothetical protein